MERRLRQAPVHEREAANLVENARGATRPTLGIVTKPTPRERA